MTRQTLNIRNISLQVFTIETFYVNNSCIVQQPVHNIASSCKRLFTNDLQSYFRCLVRAFVHAQNSVKVVHWKNALLKLACLGKATRDARVDMANTK